MLLQCEDKYLTVWLGILARSDKNGESKKIPIIDLTARSRYIPQIMNSIRVTRSYLQLLSPSALRGALLAEGARIVHACPCPIALFRYLYAEVGRNYRWADRLGWTDAQCAEHLANPDASSWVMYEGNAPAGYFELRQHDDGSVEIAYFGLLGDFIGHGLGKQLLSAAANSAVSLGASRVWLHTCTLDNPAALPNYLARGFETYREESYDVTR
jgi:ribosomal protein S18 acetylase RimI-like enzyme